MATTTMTVNLDARRSAERLRRAADALEGPTFGDVVEDGGVLGTIVRCEQCGGSGQLHDPVDGASEPVEPDDQEGPAGYDPADDLRAALQARERDLKWAIEQRNTARDQRDRAQDAESVARTELQEVYREAARYRRRLEWIACEVGDGHQPCCYARRVLDGRP